MISTGMFRIGVPALLLLQDAFAQSPISTATSCVQVSTPEFSACPCDAATFKFSMVGETSVAANTVNVALVLDGSGSIYSTDWELEKDFAKDVIASFESKNLFSNGGAAAYVQFSYGVASSGTFASSADYNTFVDADVQYGGGTDITAGISEGRDLLNASPSSAAIMIVITDGNAYDPSVEADAARAEGTTVFAVGVGSSVSEATLLAIGGEAINVFDIDSFDELGLALEGIVSSTGGAIVSCPATGVTVTVDFAAPVISVTDYPAASISGTDTVTFPVDDLESIPTEFSVVLDTCSLLAGTGFIVDTVTYSDDQSNSPSFLEILSTMPTLTCGGTVTPAPTTTGTVGGPTSPPIPVVIATSAPTSAPTAEGGMGIPTSPPVDGTGGGDCTACSNLTSAQQEALASYDNGGKKIVCDPTCVDGVSDPSHCNYFGLGQICRGCGDCSVCTPCP